MAPVADATVTRRAVELQRAVVRWLADEGALGVGLQTATRPAKCRALVAAFWSRRQRARRAPAVAASAPPAAGPGLVPSRTAIIEYRPTRRACWDCADADAMLAAWQAAKRLCTALEGEIRAGEPELREAGELFAELATWRYERSRDPRYASARRETDRLERALYHGTRFETLRRAGVADHLYLATPVGAVLPGEVALGWGLLWVAPDDTVTVVVPPPTQRCLPEDRLLLVQHIAAAGLPQLLAAGRTRRRAR